VLNHNMIILKRFYEGGYWKFAIWRFWER